MPGPPRLIEVSALGVRVPCEVQDAATADAVRSAWRDALTDDDALGATPAVSVGLDPRCNVSGGDTTRLLHFLSPAVTLRAIAARAGELLMFHAAALAEPASGATILLVAPSGTGKTTAAVTLGRHLAYLTDETAGITAEGLVVPYRKPLSIIEAGAYKAQRAPSELGLLTTERPCHAAALLLLDRRPSHEGEPTLTRLDTIDAIAALAPETSSLDRLDRPLHRLAEVVGLAGGAHQVTYSEAADLLPVARRLLGAGT